MVDQEADVFPMVGPGQRLREHDHWPLHSGEVGVAGSAWCRGAGRLRLICSSSRHQTPRLLCGLAGAVLRVEKHSQLRGSGAFSLCTRLTGSGADSNPSSTTERPLRSASMTW